MHDGFGTATKSGRFIESEIRLADIVVGAMTGEAMLSQNRAVLDSAIGNANYDIGHVFGTVPSGGSGLAGLAVVGSSSEKAKGVSLSADPTSASFLGLALVRVLEETLHVRLDEVSVALGELLPLGTGE